VGHGHNGSGVARLLYHKVYFAFAQQAFKHAEHFDFLGKW
jgi:hypothetical protein